MTRPHATTMAQAIANHLDAWQAFQDAPDGPPSAHAEDELQLEEYNLAAMPASSAADVSALLAHLEWYYEEEYGQATTVLVAMRANIRWAMGFGT